MSGSPKWKVYDKDGMYRGAMRYAEDAASFVATLGDGATIRWDHGKVLWREGAEAQSAAESFDYVASEMMRRRR